LEKFKNISNLSDNEVIDLYIKTKDKNYVGDLYKRHTSFVFLICMKYLKDKDKSKDAVMQIFEKLFDDLLKHQISNFKSWLHTVARNHCLLIIRSETYKLKKEGEIKKDLDLFMESDNNLHQTENEETDLKISKLQDAINELNDEQKICVNLFYIEDKSYVEIVEITKFDIKKVKSYIQNGKRNLKNILEKSGISSFIVLLINFFG